MSKTIHIQHDYKFVVTDYRVDGDYKRARINTLGYGETVEMEAVEKTEADAVAMLARRIRDRIAVLGEMLEIVEGIEEQGIKLQ